MRITDKPMRVSRVRDGSVIGISFILIVGCSPTQGANQAFPPPKLPPGEVQKRQYQAEQEQQAAFEREMRERGARLRAEIAARPKKLAGTQVGATRCGQYFLYYDYDFMYGEPVRRRMFTFPHFMRQANVPFGFTVSYTPPDAEVDWIDEVETGSYAQQDDRRELYVHSRGRKIPRAKVVPVPYIHSLNYHDPIYFRGKLCGKGEAYSYVE